MSDTAHECTTTLSGNDLRCYVLGTVSLLDPTLDAVFKLLLVGSQSLLLNMLTAVLREPIESLAGARAVSRSA